MNVVLAEEEELEEDLIAFIQDRTHVCGAIPNEIGPGRGEG